MKVEGNIYFTKEALHEEFFTKSEHQTVCPWKGTAHYLSLTVEGKVNENAAWYYPTPKDAAKEITGRIAFWRGVTIE